MHFLKKKASPPTKEQQRAAMLERMGVENPQTRNVGRNVMLTQIESFDSRQLRPAQDEQRYMISPHTDVRNFLANARGMGEQAMGDNHPLVRPVFKDDRQRADFHELAQKNLTGLGSFGALPAEKQRRYRVFEQLRDWSHEDAAMMDFKGVDTKRSHPIVFVQGHGLAGDKHMYSDSGEKVSSRQVASLIDRLQVPKVSQVRVNSCFSGTRHDLSEMSDVRTKFQQQRIEQRAGSWSATFAGSLDEHLNRSSYKSRYQAHQAEVDALVGRPLGTLGKVKSFFDGNNFSAARKQAIDQVSERHNRVVGYMGPTTQGAVDQATTRSALGKLGTRKHTAVVFGPDQHPDYYKHGDVSRKGPSVRNKR